MMLDIPNLLSAAEASQWRARLEQAPWQSGQASAGHQAARAKHNQQLADTDPLGAELGALLIGRLASTPRFIAAALPAKVFPPRFNRYAGQNQYGQHIDSAILSAPGTNERLRSDLSATLFLSDPESYDGGELVSENGLNRDPVKLPAGHLLLYPGDSLHHVTPVTGGTRYAAFFWVQSLVRQSHRRAMLLQLDDAIQAIGQDMPDHPELTRLTGLYHNLLRDWADT